MALAVTILGLIAVIAGVLFLVKAVFARTKQAFKPPRAHEQFDTRLLAALENRRTDARLGLVLIASGSLLAAPYFLGIDRAPSTLTTLACAFVLFLSAHSRYARQLRASQPERFKALISTTVFGPPES
ncbi:MAG: hypothetical protein ACXWCX_05285 [Burkholderiales bacterium]